MKTTFKYYWFILCSLIHILLEFENSMWERFNEWQEFR